MIYSRQHPSSRYLELLEIYKNVHTVGLVDQNIPPEDAFSGQSLAPHLAHIKSLLRQTGARSVLDYGSGKATKYAARDIKIDGQIFPSLQAYWNAESIVCYDPAYEPLSRLPEGVFDSVVCTDVLEHIPESDIPWILEEQFRYATRLVFGNVACYSAKKHLPNGENAHCTVRPADWWEEMIKAASSRSGSKADYLFLAETKFTSSRWFGLRKKQISIRTAISNRQEWSA